MNVADAKETIDQLAEAAELLDRGALLRQRHVDALGDGRELDAQVYREQAWLMFREAELRMALTQVRSVRDSGSANVELSERWRKFLDERGGDL